MLWQHWQADLTSSTQKVVADSLECLKYAGPLLGGALGRGIVL